MARRKTHLDSNDLHKLELNFEQDKLRKLQEKEFDFQIKLKLMEIELMKKDAELLTLKKSKMVSLNQQLKDTHVQFLAELRKKYKLPEKWGFNPDSGELIVED